MEETYDLSMRLGSFDDSEVDHFLIGISILDETSIKIINPNFFLIASLWYRMSAITEKAVWTPFGEASAYRFNSSEKQV